LVKNAPLLLEDGTVGLPVYHQMASKHGELLRLDDEGNVIGKNRMTAGYPALQPSVISLNDRSDALVAFLRNGSDDDASKMLRTTSNDGGLNWTSMTESNVFNPNSAVSATQSENGMLLVFNNHPHNRDVLSLAYSEDEGHNWQEIYVLESEPNAHKADHTNEFSYPWIVSTPDGIYHLFYTWQRSRIKHVTFNDTWLKAQL